MKPLFIISLIAFSVLPIFGSAQADNAAVEKTLLQMERDWTEALSKNDAAASAKFMADDWVGIDVDGKSHTKAENLADLKAATSVTQSYENGPAKVRVFGNTAVATGSETEKSSYKGKDTSGTYVWTDVWVMRDGHWQAVASQVSKGAK